MHPEMFWLVSSGLIWEVQYAIWLANMQIKVCFDLRDFNKACPKDFAVPHMGLLIDATTAYEALSFINDIRDITK